MVYAEIEGTLCTNIIECDEQFAAEAGYIELPEGYGIGDSYDGESWVRAPQPEPEPEPEPPKTAYDEMAETYTEGVDSI